MGAHVRRIDYFYTVVEDRPGEAYELLGHLSDAEVRLLAFSGLPLGMSKTQLVVFPADTGRLQHVAALEGLELTGPQHAFLITSDDHLNSLLDLHRRLFLAGINVVCATGMADETGRFGYIVYVRQEEYERAAEALTL
ncbi:MAG: hypothetical protein AB7I50_17165 [Vicinamibacterales bacterium]